MGNNIEFSIMQLIMYGGDARNAAMQAIRAARNDDFELADKYLVEAEEKMNDAHNYQTQLIFSENNGNPIPFSLLLVHAQDHVMNAMTVKEIAVEMIEMMRKEKMNKEV